jgi:hypothetical protein
LINVLGPTAHAQGSLERHNRVREGQFGRFLYPNIGLGRNVAFFWSPLEASEGKPNMPAIITLPAAMVVSSQPSSANFNI